MIVLPLHDPTRHPADWTAWISPSQYAVFLSDAQTRNPLAEDGSLVASKAALVCYVFDSLADAQAFCRPLVESHKRMLCEIYDHRGKSVNPLATFTHRSFAHHVVNRRSAWRKIWMGWLLFAIAPPFFWYDYLRDGLLILPTLIGFACVVNWFRLLAWGHGELKIVREQEARVAQDRGSVVGRQGH